MTRSSYLHVRCLVILAAFAAYSVPAQEIPKRGGLGQYGDRQARPAADWMKKTIIYQVWLKSYAEKNALIQAGNRLEHIAGLGATMLQLSPIHPHTAGSPYSVEDYYAIDPRYGTTDDFRRFIDRAHGLGLKVIMDVVFYHTSKTSVLMKEPELYMHDDQGRLVSGQWALPRLDLSNAKTRRYLINNLLYWVKEFGVDGFRADVAAGVGRPFWDEARDALDAAKPGVFLLAEGSDPTLLLHAFDATYGVEHMWTLFKTLGHGADASELRGNWERERKVYPRGSLILRAVDNHDQRRAVTEFGNDAALAAMVLNLTMDGIPFIYNGQEIGDPNPTSVNFFYPIDWQQERTKAVEIEGFRHYRGSYLGQDLDIYKSLIRTRLEKPALTDGATIWIANDNERDIVSYLRRKKDQDILVVVNLSNRRWTGLVDLPSEEFHFKMLVGRPAGQSLPSQLLKLSLGPFEYIVAERTKP